MEGQDTTRSAAPLSGFVATARRDRWGVNWPTAVPLRPGLSDSRARRPLRNRRRRSARRRPAVRPGATARPASPARCGWRARRLADVGFSRARRDGDGSGLPPTVAARRIDSPTFCHGVAGLLQVTLRFASQSALPLFVDAARDLDRQIVEAFEPGSALVTAMSSPAAVGSISRVSSMARPRPAGADCRGHSGGAALGRAFPVVMTRRDRALYEAADFLQFARTPLLSLAAYSALDGPRSRADRPGRRECRPTGAGGRQPWSLLDAEDATTSPGRRSARNWTARLRYLIRMSTRPTPSACWPAWRSADGACHASDAVRRAAAAAHPTRHGVVDESGDRTRVGPGRSPAASPRRHLAAWIRAGRVFLGEQVGRGENDAVAAVSVRATGAVRAALVAARQPIALDALTAVCWRRFRAPPRKRSTD